MNDERQPDEHERDELLLRQIAEAIAPQELESDDAAAIERALDEAALHSTPLSDRRVRQIMNLVRKQEPSMSRSHTQAAASLPHPSPVQPSPKPAPQSESEKSSYQVAMALAAVLLLCAGLWIGSGIVGGGPLGGGDENRQGGASSAAAGDNGVNREDGSERENAAGDTTTADASALRLASYETTSKMLVARPQEDIPAEPVKTGDTLATARGDRRRASLPDGSVVYLNENTRLRVAEDRRLELQSGELFVEVAQQVDKSSGERAPFVVATVDREVKALGTKFAVAHQDAGTRVLVTQGKVAVSGVEQTLLAGQQLLLKGEGGAADENVKPEITAAQRASHLLSWTSDLLAAAQSPLVPGNEHAGGALIAVDPSGQKAKLSLRKYHVDVHIENGFARTTIDQTYFNHYAWRMEGTFYFPLPPDASLSRLAMYVGPKLMEGGMAEREHARNVFEQIMYTQRDPALLEWVDGSTFKMRVFPLEGRQEKRILISYTQKLPSSYGQTRYRFPTGHSLEAVRDWSARVRVRGGSKLHWESPSHELKARREGGDLILTGEARGVKLDKDLVVTLQSGSGSGSESSSAPLESGVRFESAELDGHRYLGVRLEPQLPGERKRERRNWVLLFESSGDRDPLLARVQIDVLRTLLENAEHDDTFSLVTAATRVGRFSDEPLPCTPENVARAVAFLDRVHLVGALDLGQAFAACKPLVQAGENSHLVHVGSGVPVLGQREQKPLLDMLPKGARYVGVGVGKRWDRALMKEAARRTGGYFTQINPDEPVSWRSFELLSTLGSPRLLEVKVAADESWKFLPLSDAIVDGEEFYAVARADKGEPLPRRVTLTGTLDGEPWSGEFPVVAVEEKAGYLPRTWARQEIDRLVAEGAAQNKQKIIELSKSTYVMSPFTSLLVLENEAMYEQFKVDRGRKDHWAMYPAPETIEVVTEPLKTPQVASPAPAEQAPAETAPSENDARPQVSQVLQTIQVRIPAPILAWPNRNNSSYRVLNVWQLYTGAYGYGYTTYASNLWTQTESDVDGIFSFHKRNFRIGPVSFAGVMYPESNINLNMHGRFDPGLLTIDRGYLYDALPARSEADFGFALSDLYRPGNHRWGRPALRALGGPGFTNLGRDGQNPLIFGFYRGVAQFTINVDRAKAADMGLTEEQVMKNIAAAVNSSIPLNKKNFWIDPVGKYQYFVGGLYPESNMESLDILMDIPITSRNQTRPIPLRSIATVERTTVPTGVGGSEPLVIAVDNSGSMVPRGWARVGSFGEFASRADFYNMYLPNASVRLGDIDYAIDANSMYDLAFSPDGRHIVVGSYTYAGGFDGIPLVPLEIAQSLKEDNELPMKELRETLVPPTASANAIELLMMAMQRGWRPQLDYQRPQFSGHQYVFTDLLAYAPGMNTTADDVRAVIEAEARAARPARIGTIDDGARRLIERARRPEWETVRVAASGDFGSGVELRHDHAGRFVLRRRVYGLDEEVVCDGESLWHLYRELGVGAKRTVSRFHRAHLTAMVPWTLPPADDLARGANVTLVDGHTVAIVPIGAAKSEARAQEKTEKDAERKQDDADGDADAEVKLQLPQTIALHLVFDEKAGRLAERRVVDQTAGEVLLRQTFSADGKIALLDKDGKSLFARQVARQASAAVDVEPKTADLVVLPLPWRTLQSVQAVLAKTGRSDNGAYDDWSEADALTLAAAKLTQDPGGMQNLIGRRFFRRGDRRIGFYTLLLSSGVSLSPTSEYDYGGAKVTFDPVADHPKSPLAKYVAETLKWYRPGQQQFKAIEGPASSFVLQLAEFQRQFFEWNGGRANSQGDAHRAEVFNEALAYAKTCPHPEWAWSLLSTVQMYGGGDFERLAAAMARFHDVPQLAYHSRYEQARMLHHLGRNEQSADLFAAAYGMALEAGVLPPIDGDFRAATQSADGAKGWTELLRNTADGLLEKNLPTSVVLLALQCQQTGDSTLAEELLAAALAQPEDPYERLVAQLAAVDYLWLTGRLPRADTLVEGMLADEKLAEEPSLWRLASWIAQQNGKLALSLSRKERAMEIEYRYLPKLINVKAVRQQYGELLGEYQRLADAIATLESDPPQDFVERIVGAADRWRSLDPDDTQAAQAAANVLTALGRRELAWDYLTTPLSEKPNEAAPWLSMAQNLRQRGEQDLALKCFALAFEAEPTNAQILWDRAQLLLQSGRQAEARKLLQRIAGGQWQPRFNWFKRQAQKHVGEP